LPEAVKNQSVFEMRDVRGTVVGFYCPPYVQGLNVTGYRLHFVTEDRKQGAHLLECGLREGTVQVDSGRGFHVLLPAGAEFAQASLTTGRKEELKKVESK